MNYKKSNNSIYQKENQEKIEKEYQFQGLLERGSEGIVYSILHKQTKELFACKKIQIPKNGTTLLRVTQEIQILNKLKHKNIINLKQILLEEINNIHYVYIIYDIAPQNLLQLIKSNKFNSIIQMKYIIVQMANALYYLHINGIIHRDIKPSNVLVYDKLCIKLCDFGSCKFLNQSEQYPPIQSVCTKIYLPPESFDYDCEETTAIDIWQLGCVFLQMLIKNPPFKGSSINSIKKSIISVYNYDNNDNTNDNFNSIDKNFNKEKETERMKYHEDVIKEKINLKCKERKDDKEKYEQLMKKDKKDKKDISETKMKEKEIDEMIFKMDKKDQTMKKEKKEIVIQFEKMIKMACNDESNQFDFLPKFFTSLNIDKDSQELIYQMLQINPLKRISAEEIVHHKTLIMFKQILQGKESFESDFEMITGNETYDDLIRLIEKEIIHQKRLLSM